MCGGRLRVGVDLVYIERVARLLESRAALERVFHPAELGDGRPEHLAGVFAAKEAFFKALGCSPQWLRLEVRAGPGGRPELRPGPGLPALREADLSISHEQDYALAAVVLRLAEQDDG
ncbi:MAG: holo-ACP synthase [Chloroflexi bacterium]|nr:holo-ACP synthase [Chloroflexota bacterium]